MIKKKYIEIKANSKEDLEEKVQKIRTEYYQKGIHIEEVEQEKLIECCELLRASGEDVKFISILREV